LKNATFAARLLDFRQGDGYYARHEKNSRPCATGGARDFYPVIHVKKEKKSM
jgi:hypothetical protein